MATFNNVLDITYHSIMSWGGKGCLNSVTIIRDVVGKISLLMDNTSYPEGADCQQLLSVLDQNLGGFFSNKIYWKKQTHSQRNEAKRIIPIVKIIEAERKIWKEETTPVFYLSERPIAKKAWVKEPEIQEAVWPYEEAVERTGPKVITFYSFKGGMGRTTALTGVALTLTQQGYNVMMVDTDIEAPGLATLFVDDNAVENGVLDYLIEHPLIPDRRMEDYILNITDPALLNESDGNLYLMPAGKIDESYLQKLARIDYQDNRENYLRDSLCTMLWGIRNNYQVDYILVDARAGFHDMGGVAGTQLPHGAVLFGNRSRQSGDGLVQVLRTLAKGHSEDWPILIVDSMCEKPTSPMYVSAKTEFTQKAYTACVENYYSESGQIPGIDAEGVPHSPEFVSFDDALLHGVQLFSSGTLEENNRVSAYKELLTGSSYNKIANQIKSWFGEE